MSITTKTGDNGRTSLYYGGRVGKDDIRIDICGALDELSSFLGISRGLLRDRKIKSLLKSVQEELFIIGAEVATKPRFISRLKKRIDSGYVKRLELVIEELERKRPLKARRFYLPGGNLPSGTLDVARTIARRAERRAVTLINKKILDNPHILVYLNRLSDLLYLLARLYDKRC